MATHNKLFKLGKKVDAYLLFKKQTNSNWCFIKYVNTMIKFNG